MAICEWKYKAQKKRAEVESRTPAKWLLSAQLLDNVANGTIENVLDIPRQSGILTDRELSLTEDFDATGLVAKLASGEIKSYDLTRAFCKRAAIAQQVTNCLTETFYELALQRAAELDVILARTGHPTGPLHGLPVSVKESFNIQGLHSTIGFVSYIDNPPAQENSALIDILLEAGAVLYVKTNVPQTLMTPDTHNNIFGRCMNPHKLSLTAGGSSGGEGALVAMKGSPLGIGTDIAGSIRIPALCNGTFGFKPSAGRVPYRGQCAAGRKGMAGVMPSAGPLTRSVRDSRLLLRAVFDARCTELDEMALAVPWREPRPREILTLGIIAEDPNLPLHPTMSRLLAEACQKLRAAGHTLIELSSGALDLNTASKVAFRYFNLDAERTPFKHMAASGEPAVPSLACTYPIDGEKVEKPTIEEFFDLNVEKVKFLNRLRNAFVNNKLDALIGPGYHGGVAVLHDTFGEPLYTVPFNLADYPACVIPFGKASEELDKPYIRDVTYDPKYLASKVESAPGHVQLVSRNLRDEDLLYIAEIVENVLIS